MQAAISSTRTMMREASTSEIRSTGETGAKQERGADSKQLTVAEAVAIMSEANLSFERFRKLASI